MKPFLKNMVQTYGRGPNVVIPKGHLPGVIAAAEKSGVKKLRNVQTLLAFSAVRWTVDGVVDGLNTDFLIAATTANERKAFGYGINDAANVAQAIDTAGYLPRWDDTNLTKAGKPPFGDMYIERLSFMIRPRHLKDEGGPQDDPYLLAALLSVLDVKISTNKGEDGYHLGSPLFWPAGSSLQGAGTDAAGAAGQVPMALGRVSGVKFVRDLQVPLVWRLNSETDGDLCVTLAPQHDAEVDYVTGDLVQSTLFVDLWCIVEGHSYGEISANG